MIGHIRGKLLFKQAPKLLIDVNGIGYEVEAPMTTFFDLPSIDQPVSLHTHLSVREDAHALYGFSNLAQRDLFRKLLKVSGIGPRVALAILSGLTAEDFISSIQREDVNQLVRIPGIGRKTAQRLIVEMKDKIQNPGAVAAASAAASAPVSPTQDAISALLALGYKSSEAAGAVNRISSDGASSEDLIRLALQYLSAGRP